MNETTTYVNDPETNQLLNDILTQNQLIYEQMLFNTELQTTLLNRMEIYILLIIFLSSIYLFNFFIKRKS